MPPTPEPTVARDKQILITARPIPASLAYRDSGKQYEALNLMAL